MRIPLSFGELSVIRSAARLLIPLFGVGLILGVLYTGTIWMERILTNMDAPTESIPSTAALVDSEGELTLPDVEFQFPYHTELESADGRKLDALLLGRPSANEIIFQRTKDNRVFSLELRRLSNSSRELLSEFPGAEDNRQTQDLFQIVFPERPLFGTGLQFPHDCTLVSIEGLELPVTLLARPSTGEVTLRRKVDRKTFTIPLTRLIKSDREFIRLFIAEGRENASHSGHR